jgi:hypothetical protein
MFNHYGQWRIVLFPWASGRGISQPPCHSQKVQLSPHPWSQLDPQSSSRRALSFLENLFLLPGHLLLLDRNFFSLRDRLVTPSRDLFQSYPLGPFIRAPESWRLLPLSSRGANNCVLWCDRKNFSSIVDSGMFTVTHCHSVAGTADFPSLVSAGSGTDLHLSSQFS